MDTAPRETTPRSDAADGAGPSAADPYDVVIIGGGPAGTTCATELTRRGHKVLILERHRFPRFHIGESITAFGFEAFHRLGVYDELAELNEIKKKGLEFVYHERTAKIYFLPTRWNQPGERPYAFQMDRATLDQVLLENARRTGVEIREEHLVKRILFDGDRAVGVEYKDLTGDDPDRVHRVHGRWIIDASGQVAVMNRQQEDNWYNDPLLEKKMAIYCHWKGDFDIQNTDQDINFKLCVHKNRRDWCWYIPIAKDTVSLGLVLSRETLQEAVKTQSLEEIFHEYAADTPFVSELLETPGIETVEKFRCTADYSYRSKQYYGNCWSIVGDSAGFIDPVFSTGLQVAFNSAFALVDPLDRLLRQLDQGHEPDLSLLEPYQTSLNRYYRVNSMLVYLFYLSELDHRKFNSGGYLWKTIEWAGLKERLQFLWHGLRYRLAKREKRLAWGTQVLFGDPVPGNVVADLYLSLSRNYDRVHARRRAARQVTAAEAEAA